MNQANLIGFFDQRGMHVFTLNDAVRVMGRKRNYVWLALSRMVSRNALHRAERGIYYTDRAGTLEIASNIVQPSYVSMLAALNHYGVSTQIPVTIDVVTTRRHRPVALEEGAKVVFETARKGAMFGFHREGGTTNMADLEKAFVDSIYFRGPGIGVVGEALENAVRGKRIDRAKLIQYAERLNSKALVKRLRSLLESVESDTGVEG